VGFILGMLFLGAKAVFGAFAAIIGGLFALGIAGGLGIAAAVVVLAIVFKLFGGGKY
jgi:hypothetical protein